MIEVKNLKKYYQVGKNIVKAVDDISFKLPDKGFVFIVGKSGSGKSTLMNVLAGLDNATSGQVLIDGLDLLKLSESKLDLYRNNYVGIIYQNFNLFLDESVIQNINVASIISKNKINNDDVDILLEKLDLLDKKNIKAKNLSGGQKQRVAIARALVKSPQMILADEPTGNLDSKTATTTFEILKNISKTRLVVVISHDQASAEKYADRIIRLSDGHVIENLVRDVEDESSSKIIAISKDSNIDNNQIDTLNKLIKDTNFKLIRRDNNFREFDDSNLKVDQDKPNFKGHKGGIKASFKVAFSFLKQTIVSVLITILVVTAGLSLLSFSQSFIEFDGSDSMNRTASEYNLKSYVMNKSYSEYGSSITTDKDKTVIVNDEDIKLFKDNNYTGNIYKLYKTNNYVKDYWNLELFETASLSNVYTSIFASVGLGTAVVDYDYLTYLYGDFNVLAGSIDDTLESSKIIVTDYFADSLLFFNSSYISDDLNDPYQKITNVNIEARYIIGAVIDTDYKNRYAELFDMFEHCQKNPQQANSIMKLIYNSKEYLQFIDEANSSLNIQYSLNPNFIEEYAKTENTFSRFPQSFVYSDSGEEFSFTPQEFAYNQIVYDLSIEDDECYITPELANYILTDKEIEYINDVNSTKDVYITYSGFSYQQDTNKDEPMLSFRLKVKGFYGGGVSNCCVIYLSNNNIVKINEVTMYPYALIFDNISQIYDVSTLANDNDFYTTNNVFTPLFEIFNIIEIFRTLFVFVLILIIGITFLVLMNHNIRAIKKNSYRVGVYRGLGYSNSYITFGSFINVLILLIGLGIFSYFSSKISVSLINSVLVTSFKTFLKTNLINDYDLIIFNFNNFIIYLLTIFGIGFISMVGPMIYIKNLKPNTILNKAE